MELLQLALLILGGVLISSLLDPLLPRVSLPLVQITLGIVFSIFTNTATELDFDTDFFLVMFIAPLLFDESKNADNRLLWKNKGSILSLAIGLAIVTALVIGFTLNLIEPTISLAACFALGAALGPTDAVAVASLGKDINLNSRQKAQLSGEALLNDASGVVSFQFAIAAAVTAGSFSLQNAGATFAVDFGGGLALGVVIGIAYFLLCRFMRITRTERATTRVLFEVCLPFFTYLVAESVHVSGIIAVVVTGLVITFIPERLFADVKARPTVHSSKIEIVSDSVWEIISFVLNGVVFFIMGLLLPTLITPIFEGMERTFIEYLHLAGIVLLLTAVMYAVRFVWLLAADYLSSNPLAGGAPFTTGEKYVKNALVTTLAGAKGAVAIAIIFTLPHHIAGGESFPNRELLIFLVCMVAVVSLLIANFVVPALAPKPNDDDSVDPDMELAILRNVLDELRNSRTEENELAINEVIRTYQHRIAAIRHKHASPKHLRTLRLEALEHAEAYIQQQIEEESVDRRTANSYLRRIKRNAVQLRRASGKQLKTMQAARPVTSTTTTFQRVAAEVVPKRRMLSEIEFRVEVETVFVRFFDSASRSTDADRATAAKALLVEHRSLLSALKQRKRRLDEEHGIVVLTASEAKELSVVRTSSGKLKRVRPKKKKNAGNLAEAYTLASHMELEQIESFRHRGRISNSVAREMSYNVHLVQLNMMD